MVGISFSIICFAVIKPIKQNNLSSVVNAPVRFVVQLTLECSNTADELLGAV